MEMCACPTASLTAVTFEQGIVLQRCSAHDTQTWVVEGEATDRAEVLENLRSVFLERREQRRRAATPTQSRPDDVISLTTPGRPVRPASAPPVVHVQLPPGATSDEQLTALLQARGLPGAWAIANA